MPLAAVLFAGLLAIGGIYAAVTEAPAQSRTLFVVGQRYTVLHSCTAQVGCYGVLITVREIRDDNWLVVQASDGTRWTLNPAHILSFTPVDARVAAVTDYP